MKVDLNGKMIEGETDFFLFQQIEKEVRNLNLTEINIITVLDALKGFALEHKGKDIYFDVKRGKGGKIKSFVCSQGKRPESRPGHLSSIPVVIPATHGTDKSEVFAVIDVFVDQRKVRSAMASLRDHGIRIVSGQALKEVDLFSLALGELRKTPGFQMAILRRMEKNEVLLFNN